MADSANLQAVEEMDPSDAWLQDEADPLLVEQATGKLRPYGELADMVAVATERKQAVERARLELTYAQSALEETLREIEEHTAKLLRQL